MFPCFRPILFLTFFNSLICVGSLIEKFYIQTVPGTKHHRFLVSLIFLLQLSFFRHNKRLQRKETISSEPYFRCNSITNLVPLVNFSSSFRFRVRQSCAAVSLRLSQSKPACARLSAWRRHSCRTAATGPLAPRFGARPTHSDLDGPLVSKKLPLRQEGLQLQQKVSTI